MTKLLLRVIVKGNKVIFEINDNGCGIEKEKLKNIFTSQFYKENIPADGSKSNAGIGLSVCATIITAHGGGYSGSELKRRWL